MINDTTRHARMHESWALCLEGRETIFKALETDVKYWTEFKDWNWEGAVTFDLYSLALTSIEAAMVELLDGMLP